MHFQKTTSEEKIIHKNSTNEHETMINKAEKECQFCDFTLVQFNERENSLLQCYIYLLFHLQQQNKNFSNSIH